MGTYTSDWSMAYWSGGMEQYGGTHYVYKTVSNPSARLIWSDDHGGGSWILIGNYGPSCGYFSGGGSFQDPQAGTWTETGGCWGGTVDVNFSSPSSSSSSATPPVTTTYTVSNDIGYDGTYTYAGYGTWGSGTINSGGSYPYYSSTGGTYIIYFPLVSYWVIINIFYDGSCPAGGYISPSGFTVPVGQWDSCGGFPPYAIVTAN